MTFSPRHLAPLVILALLPAPSVRAQFTAAGGIASPLGPAGAGFNRGLYRGAAYGAGLGAGLGWGATQWMQNPYEGYMNGAANITTANAQYQLTIQQARLAREESRRSALQTRRATIEERQYELSLMPDPDVIRQKELQRGYQRSRNNPPASEIWSGRALNDLLRGITDATSRGVVGPEVPLNSEVLRHVNVTTGVTYGGTGLLKDGGKLTWPYALRKSPFDSERTKINEQMGMAVKQAQSGEVSVELLNDIDASLKDLSRAIDARVEEVTPSEYIQGTRYLRELKESYKLLQQSDVSKYFKPNWTPSGSTVADLVKQMTQQGLKFGPAVSGDESYYTVLHRAMVDYDLGLAQLTASAPRR